MKLICITGIDGAGKTTLARNTVTALQRQGQPASYLYGRTYPIVSRLLMALGRLTMLRRYNQWKNYPAYTTQKKQLMRHPLLVWLYTAAILVDYFPQIWWKLLPHLFSQRVVVLDRYIYDTVISDLAVHLNYSHDQAERAIVRGLKWLPKPALTLLIDLPEEVAFWRKNDVPHLEYLRERRHWYLQLCTRPEVERHDGQTAPEMLLLTLVEKITAQRSAEA